jgi:hypothetical protein
MPFKIVKPDNAARGSVTSLLRQELACHFRNDRTKGDAVIEDPHFNDVIRLAGQMRGEILGVTVLFSASR